MEKISFFKNLYYKLFWSPNEEHVYHCKDERHSQGHHGTVTHVYFMNGEGERFVCSFCVHKNGKTEVRIKSEPSNRESDVGLHHGPFGYNPETKDKKLIETDKLDFMKKVYNLPFPSQGEFGGKVFEYIVKER